MKHMRKAAAMMLAALTIASCSDNNAFHQEAPGAPEFYRLRIADQIINVSIDSTETVQIKGTYPNMAADYTVSGSENCEKIRELALKQMDLQSRAIAIQKDPSLTIDRANDSIQSIINAYKDEVKRNYIYKEPMKAYSYFALFQAIGNYLIFNPWQLSDLQPEEQQG